MIIVLDRTGVIFFIGLQPDTCFFVLYECTTLVVSHWYKVTISFSQFLTFEVILGGHTVDVG
ncbi:ORF943 [White spot syndrome virus]|uniref:ORF943 n=1 Tax=White spot syndrome virus TaxID=342409 RepID=A0A2D3I727_9VIRU|nr:ORF943 [White spot syndrome virus]